MSGWPWVAVAIPSVIVRGHPSNVLTNVLQRLHKPHVEMGLCCQPTVIIESIAPQCHHFKSQRSSSFIRSSFHLSVNPPTHINPSDRVYCAPMKWLSGHYEANAIWLVVVTVVTTAECGAFGGAVRFIEFMIQPQNHTKL